MEDAAHSNVVSRLCSSAPVKTAMKDIVDNIRAALVIHTDVFEENSGKDFQESVDIKSSKPHDQITSPGSVDSDTESSDDGEMDLDIKSLASSESSSSSPNTPRTVVRSSRKQPQLPLKSTTFLPSLAQGGYLSGSDSNASDLEDDLTASKPRKNRRGQQERRIIWERKYGDKANHKKNPKQGRNEGWDPRKGAQLDGQRSNSRFKERGRSKVDREKHQTSRASGANSAPVNRKENLKKVDAGPIHPSWEAARKLKEQKNTTAFTGKKLVFD